MIAQTAVMFLAIQAAAAGSIQDRVYSCRMDREIYLVAKGEQAVAHSNPTGEDSPWTVLFNDGHARLQSGDKNQIVEGSERIDGKMVDYKRSTWLELGPAAITTRLSGHHAFFVGNEPCGVGSFCSFMVELNDIDSKRARILITPAAGAGGEVDGEFAAIHPIFVGVCEYKNGER